MKRQFCGQGRRMGQHILVCLLPPGWHPRHYDWTHGVYWREDYS